MSRAGGLARAFLVLYLTQERGLSPTTAGAVVGFSGTAVALVALGSAETVPAICAAAVGVGLTAELFRPVGSAAVADLPAHERVRAFGLLFWAANLGFTVSTSPQESWSNTDTASCFGSTQPPRSSRR
jgi:MFS family permease